MDSHNNISNLDGRYHVPELPPRRQPYGSVDDEEEKTLNIDPYERNIHREEYDNEYDDHSSTVHRSRADKPFCHSRYRTLWTGLTVCLITSFLAVALSAFCVIKYNEAVTELRVARENREKVCLSCDDQYIQLDTWKKRNENGECCVRLEELLSMMKEIADSQASRKIQEAEELRNAKFSSAPLTSASSPVRRISAHAGMQGGSAHQTNHWMCSFAADDRTHLEGLLFDTFSGALTINSTGYYYIYSQLTVYANENNNDTALAHQVRSREFQSGSFKKLMNGSNMMWKSKMNRSYRIQTSYSGGTFFLRKGAIVYTFFEERARPMLASCTVDECFFGLYKL